MIGKAYAQLAESLGLSREQGVYYGILENYAVTFLDGTGCHRIMITTRFDTPSQKDDLMNVIDSKDLKSLYNIRKLQIAKKVIHVVFRNKPDTMEKIRSFIDWFFPLLPQYGASPADVCVQCMEPIEGKAQWVLRDGAVAFRMHKRCADELKIKLGYTPGSSTSVQSGLKGAALYTLFGVAIWVVLQLVEWLAPVAGLAIGWLAVSGYESKGGKRIKWQLPMLALVAALGVAFATAAGVIALLIQGGAGTNAFGLFFETFPQLQDNFFSDMGLGMVLMLMGLALSWRNRSRRGNAMTAAYLGEVVEEEKALPEADE